MKKIAPLLTLSLLALASVARADTTLTFDDLNLGNYGDIPLAYGSYAAGTQNIGVSYRTFNATTNATLTNNLDLWNSGYGDLNKVAFATTDGYASEIAFTPNAGYEFTLASFDIGSYPGSNRPISFLRLVDANNNLLLDLTPAPATIPGIGHTTFSPNFTYAGAVKLQHGNDWDLGLDNIKFSQRIIVPPSAIPEPGTLALCTLPLLGFLRKRRK